MMFLPHNCYVASYLPVFSGYFLHVKHQLIYDCVLPVGFAWLVFWDFGFFNVTGAFWTEEMASCKYQPWSCCNHQDYLWRYLHMLMLLAISLFSWFVLFFFCRPIRWIHWLKILSAFYFYYYYYFFFWGGGESCILNTAFCKVRQMLA